MYLPTSTHKQNVTLDQFFFQVKFNRFEFKSFHSPWLVSIPRLKSSTCCTILFTQSRVCFVWYFCLMVCQTLWLI